MVAYIISAFLSRSQGLFNQILTDIGLEPVFFMGEVDLFRPIIIVSYVWKSAGWGTILYLAAITNIDQQLYEAAYAEGAGRWAQVRYITLPMLAPTISILLILNIPNLLSAGFNQIYPLMNSINIPVSDVLDTYILRNGILQGKFGMSTAMGLLSSIVKLSLIYFTNKASKAISGHGI